MNNCHFPAMLQGSSLDTRNSNDLNVYRMSSTNVIRSANYNYDRIDTVRGFARSKTYALEIMVAEYVSCYLRILGNWKALEPRAHLNFKSHNLRYYSIQWTPLQLAYEYSALHTSILTCITFNI